MDKKKIMKRAWAIAKKKHISLAKAMKEAWK
jgi:hypothetical protein